MTFEDWTFIADQNRQLSVLAEIGDLQGLRLALGGMDWNLPKMADFEFYTEHCRHTWGPPEADVAQVVAWTPEDAHVLDIGFGYGHVLRELNNEQRELYGIDSSAKAVALLQEELPEACLQVSDILALTTLKLVDAVVCMEVLEHLSPAQGHRMLELLGTGMKDENSRLLLSTRINENLGRSLMACPECGQVLHPAGHVRTFSETLLFAELFLAGWWVAEAIRSPGGILLRCAKHS